MYIEHIQTYVEKAWLWLRKQYIVFGQKIKKYTCKESQNAQHLSKLRYISRVLLWCSAFWTARQCEILCNKKISHVTIKMINNLSPHNAAYLRPRTRSSLVQIIDSPVLSRLSKLMMTTHQTHCNGHTPSDIVFATNQFPLTKLHQRCCLYPWPDVVYGEMSFQADRFGNLYIFW